MGAGKYRNRFEWLAPSDTKEPTYGEVVEVLESVGELWGRLEDLSAAEKIQAGMLQQSTTVKIYIRNLPPIGFKDQLKDKATGDVYSIDGLVKMHEDNETIVWASK